MSAAFSAFFHIVVSILLCLITLGIAISFAVRPTDRKLQILRPMTWATLFSILAACGGGLGITTLHASMEDAAGGQRDIFRLIMNGVAEALVPAVYGFVVLSLSWLLVSVGLRRQN